MEAWVKLLIIIIVCLALGFFGTKYIKDKIEMTVQEQDNQTGGSENFSSNNSGVKDKEDSNFGNLGDLFNG